MSTLTVTSDHDYSSENLSNITEIDFNNTFAARIVFVASQFDNTHISQSVHIVVNNSFSTFNSILIPMASPTTFSAAN